MKPRASSQLHLRSLRHELHPVLSVVIPERVLLLATTEHLDAGLIHPRHQRPFFTRRFTVVRCTRQTRPTFSASIFSSRHQRATVLGRTPTIRPTSAGDMSSFMLLIIHDPQSRCVRRAGPMPVVVYVSYDGDVDIHPECLLEWQILHDLLDERGYFFDGVFADLDEDRVVERTDKESSSRVKLRRERYHREEHKITRGSLDGGIDCLPFGLHTDTVIRGEDIW